MVLIRLLLTAEKRIGVIYKSPYVEMWYVLVQRERVVPRWNDARIIRSVVVDELIKLKLLR
jgi:hypothetical protein